jgi:hypothetical protein
LIASRGSLPPGLPVEALEISRHLDPREARTHYPQLGRFPLLQGGDVHRLEEFMGVNALRMTAPTVAEMRLAFRGEAGRGLEICQQY